MYRTVVIRGKMELLEDEMDRGKGIEVIIKHLEKHPEEIMAKVHGGTETWRNTMMMRLMIAEITGKQGR